MNVRVPQQIPAETVRKLQELVATTASRQEVIRAMRAEHLPIVDCIKLFAALYGVSLGEAKEVVHGSEAWAAERDTYDAFHSRTEESVERESLTSHKVAVSSAA